MKQDAVSLNRRALLGAAAVALTPKTWAQAWPAKPVRMVIAFPPGGPTDIVSRVIAQQLSVQLGVSVVIDNKPGAGGNIAAELVARAPADGYTVFYNTSAIVIGPALYSKVNYDPVKDFAPVATVGAQEYILCVNPGVPAANLREFIAYAKGRQLYFSS